jgi:hypothetical protein
MCSRGRRFKSETERGPDVGCRAGGGGGGRTYAMYDALVRRTWVGVETRRDFGGAVSQAQTEVLDSFVLCQLGAEHSAEAGKPFAPDLKV